MVKHIILAACLFSSFSIYAWEYPAADNPQTIVDFYSLGLGTPEEPYVITTAQQLANFSYVINSGMDTCRYKRKSLQRIFRRERPLD